MYSSFSLYHHIHLIFEILIPRTTQINHRQIDILLLHSIDKVDRNYYDLFKCALKFLEIKEKIYRRIYIYF